MSDLLTAGIFMQCYMSAFSPPLVLQFYLHKSPYAHNLTNSIIALTFASVDSLGTYSLFSDLNCSIRTFLHRVRYLFKAALVYEKLLW